MPTADGFIEPHEITRSTYRKEVRWQRPIWFWTPDSENSLQKEIEEIQANSLKD
jgi:hypothetical protein